MTSPLELGHPQASFPLSPALSKMNHMTHNAVFNLLVQPNILKHPTEKDVSSCCVNLYPAETEGTICLVAGSLRCLQQVFQLLICRLHDCVGLRFEIKRNRKITTRSQYSGTCTHVYIVLKGRRLKLQINYYLV